MPACQPGQFPVLSAFRADYLPCSQAQGVSVGSDAPTAGRATFRGRRIGYLQLLPVTHNCCDTSPESTGAPVAAQALIS